MVSESRISDRRGRSLTSETKNYENIIPMAMPSFCVRVHVSVRVCVYVCVPFMFMHLNMNMNMNLNVNIINCILKKTFDIGLLQH
jgi:hypothetical protein